jgi:hypothetical protein
MKLYLNGSDAVSDLHGNGFINDFQSFGDKIWWIQEHLFIHPGEFSVLEHHRIETPNRRREEFDVLGIVAPFHNIKGILIKHLKNKGHRQK